MKLLFSALLLAQVCCFSGTVRATSNDHVATSPQAVLTPLEAQEGRFRLRYAATGDADHVTVRILDAQGQVIRRDQTRNISFARVYNFSEMPYGSYTVQVTTPTGTQEFPVAHQAPTLAQPRVALKALSDKRYQVTVNGTSSAPFVVRIVDQNQQLISIDVTDKKSSFSRVYDLSKLANTNVVFEVGAGYKLLANVNAADVPMLAVEADTE
ncbi:Por secretion system C-terminal sorting domain-containing protein [Catalinimonas alkaloidigena]|uniref:Por secretion system C-terminal sorting domain-containing protein n=1 Tax=Catalinimonas alkaloidigena TaxID=1075417 RepID=A0A1G9T6T7_9BACT|nr:hypothetical protein [Catalinimonas alkaloidigena]SDM43342.1 Por secretion system C-terminal sorting domain-containing protein [Catalinimonas alkaloidigena]